MLYPAFANDIQKWRPYKMNKMLTFANTLALSYKFKFLLSERKVFVKKKIIFFSPETSHNPSS